MIEMAVKIYINGVQVARGTGYDFDEKWDTSEEDTFDGPIYEQGEYPKYTVKISKIDTYNSQYENILRKAIDDYPEGIPITVVDDNVTDIFTGCIIESRSIKRDPKKKRTVDFSFKAKTYTPKRT